MDRPLLVAVVVGLLQGLFEWLPVSSEGQVTLYLTLVEGLPAATATRFSLFLHAGTAASALAYYRSTVRSALRSFLGRPRGPARRDDGGEGGGVERSPAARFLAVATLVSACSGAVAYLALDAVGTALAGGAFVSLVGVLLVATGLFQRRAAAVGGRRTTPTVADAALVGTLQGLAVLPGVSRSGTTTGALLLRGYDAAESFRLSFLLSIPAALGAGVLVVVREGVPVLAPEAAAVALATSALVGYCAIGAMMRVAERVAFWRVCTGLGLLAVVAGALAAA